MKAQMNWTPANMGKKGGRARAKKLTPTQRSEIARKGALVTNEIKKRKRKGTS